MIKFKAGDVVVSISDPEKTYKVVSVSMHDYTLQRLTPTKNIPTFDVSHYVVEQETRKLTKLDKALK